MMQAPSGIIPQTVTQKLTLGECTHTRTYIRTDNHNGNFRIRFSLYSFKRTTHTQQQSITICTVFGYFQFWFSLRIHTRKPFFLGSFVICIHDYFNSFVYIPGIYFYCLCFPSEPTIQKNISYKTVQTFASCTQTYAFSNHR